MQDPIDQSSGSHDRVCVITWSAVLISFDLSFGKGRGSPWSHHAVHYSYCGL